MSFIASIVFLLLVLFVVHIIYKKETVLKRFFLPALISKCLGGIALGMIYHYYYREGDTLQFFAEAEKLTELCRKDFGSYASFLFTSRFGAASIDLIFEDQRAIYLVKIVSVFNYVGFGNYWIVSVYFSLISFLAAWYLVKQIHEIYPEATIAACGAFLFFPSITFWTAGIIKESLAMAALFFISAVVVNFCSKRRVHFSTVVISFVAVIVLWKLKYYFAGIFLSVVIATIIHYVTQSRLLHVKPVTSFLLWALVFSLVLAGATLLHPNFNVHRLFNVMVQNYNAFLALSPKNNVVYFNDLEPTLTSIMANSPKALITGLFRPFIWESTNALSVIVAIENLLLLILTAVAIRHSKLIFTAPARIHLLAIVVYVILLSIFVTLSTPNFGTLARYRVGYLPFFVFLLLLAPTVNGWMKRVFRFTTGLI